VTELARSFGLDKSTISRQLQPLRAAGLIHEAPDETNRRVWQISVSGTGHDLFERVAAAQIDYWSQVLARLPDPDRHRLAVALEQLRAAMDAHDATLGSFDDDED
jgi:DNA-binding MarR family transcriptional regulator